MPLSQFLIALCCALFSTIGITEAASLRIGTFTVDASPPIGSPLAYDPCESVQLPLTCCGIVLLGNDQPIVLCALDWIGIGNGGHDEWRTELAKAAGTSPGRVSVHTLHQHDAPICDFETADLVAKHGLDGYRFDNNFGREILSQASDAVKHAIKNAVPVTHIGLGAGEVQKVASNRRILDENGKVRAVRYTATRDPKLRAEPEGTIDPLCRVISFFQNEQPVAVVSYYATHPQSYYRTGKANPDFPGMARMMRNEALQTAKKTGPLHIHFNGAGGNIGAGKYNDGSPENRLILARRLAEGMQLAWEDSLENRRPIVVEDLNWKSTTVQLPPAKHLAEKTLVAILEDDEQNADARVAAARSLVWLKRCQKGVGVEIGCLTLGDARVLHMPGELVVEYQLEAQKMRPDLFVAMAAYADYAPGYICRSIHYEEGGYESSQRASRVAPEVEDVLRTAMQELLDVSDK